ncbi:MAG TPA: histidine kinase [Thermoanaerobaculia bacterium]|nr:histidine kinase [Thermoanaerobaculia bacterium]
MTAVLPPDDATLSAADRPVAADDVRGAPLTLRATTRRVFAVWTAYGLFFSLQVYFTYVSTYRPIAIADAFGSQMIAALIWAVGTLWTIRVSRRWPIDRVNWKRRLLVHALHCVAFTVVLGAAHAYVDTYFFRKFSMKLETFRAFLFMLDREITTYWAVVFVTQAYDYHWRFRNVQLRAVQLQSELATARLDLLRVQLHPHFLFNTLNTISSVIHEDVDAADRMIANLGQFLRATLAQSETPEVTLRQELELLDCYLQIQKVRFEDELQLDFEIAPDVLDALVPTLLLQPLAENAIKHGLNDGSGNVILRIVARRDGSDLFVQVCDTGDGSLSPARTGLGVGLANTQMRLRQLYGDSQRLEFERRAGEGFLVTLRIPLHAG